MRKYMIYLDDGYSCFKEFVPADSENEAVQYVKGNGEVLAVKDITEECPISLDSVVQALENALYEQKKIDLIARCLEMNNIAQWKEGTKR